MLNTISRLVVCGILGPNREFVLSFLHAHSVAKYFQQFPSFSRPEKDLADNVLRLGGFDLATRASEPTFLATLDIKEYVKD